jgi:hypothetical protein
MVVLMKKLVIILLIIWHTWFNLETIEGLLTNNAFDMRDEPEKMDVLTKLSKHLPSWKNFLVPIPQTHPTTQTTSRIFFPNTTQLSKNRAAAPDLIARTVFRKYFLNLQ